MSTLYPIVYKKTSPCIIADDVIGSKQFSLQEELLIPKEKPDVEEIDEVKIEFCIDSLSLVPIIDKRCQQLSLKLIISGIIKEKLIYIADLPSQPVHLAHFNTPFCTFTLLEFDIALKKDISCLESKLSHLEEYLHVDPCVEAILIREVNSYRFIKCMTILISVVGNLDNLIDKIKG